MPAVNNLSGEVWRVIFSQRSERCVYTMQFRHGNATLHNGVNSGQNLTAKHTKTKFNLQ